MYLNIYIYKCIHTQTLYKVKDVCLFHSQNAPAISKSLSRSDRGNPLESAYIGVIVNRPYGGLEFQRFQNGGFLLWTLMPADAELVGGKLDNPVSCSTHWGIGAETGCRIAGTILIAFNRISTSTMDLPKML